MSEALDANQYLLDRYQGEVLGAAFFGLLAELEEDAGWRLRWRLLERHERHVGSRLRQELDARALETAPDPVKAQEGRRLATAIWELPVESRVNAMIPALRDFVADFREAADAAPSNFSEVAQLVLDHEVALLEFFEAMARDDAAGANAAIEDFLRAVGAPDEQPIPEGIALTPLDPAFRADPNPSFHLLLERAPVHRDRGFGNRVVLTRHDDVMRVVRDLEFWVDPRKSLPDDPVRMFISAATAESEPSMLFLDDPEHRRLRNFVSRSFTPRTMERSRPIIREVARELVDSVEADASAEFDLMEALAAPLPAIAIARLLGVDTRDQAKFKIWSVASSEAFFNPFAGDDIKRRGELASIALGDYFAAEVQKRRESPSDDLIGQMVAAEMEGDQLTIQEIITMCNLLLIAGNVTTTDLIGNGMRALLGNPDQHRRLREKPELIENAVEEMLRFDPPVTSTGRIAPRDIEIDGIPIRQGESITLLLAAANRDPAIYPDPDRFDVEREDTHHQSFGGGAHLCLGAHLARIEAQEAIGALVDRFPNLSDAGRAPVYKQTPGFRGLAEYWVSRD